MKFNFKKNFSECIGNTPIIKLKVASELSGCEIYGKCEFLNPGGSVKDRPALQIIKDAIIIRELGTKIDLNSCCIFHSGAEGIKFTMFIKNR